MGSDASAGSHAIFEPGELDVSSLLHGLFLSYVQFTAGIVPVTRFRSLVGLMRDALYKVTGVPTMGLITIHSLEKTLDKYCALLEASGVAEKATAVVEDPKSFRFNVRGCMFGGTAGDSSHARMSAPSPCSPGSSPRRAAEAR